MSPGAMPEEFKDQSNVQRLLDPADFSGGKQRLIPEGREEVTREKGKLNKLALFVRNKRCSARRPGLVNQGL